VQHDCREAKCTASGKRTVVQERTETQLTEAFLEHQPLARFLINTHSFHNAHLLRSVLPRNLTSPIPFSSNRRAHHDVLAIQLHGTRDLKRQQVADKRKAMDALKKGAGGGGSVKRKRLDISLSDRLGETTLDTT